VADGLAASLDAARVVAGVFALEVVARFGGAAVAIVLALTSGAFDERVSSRSGGANADWSVCAGGVVSGLALGSLSAGVGRAQVGLGELPARVEGVAGEPSGTRADGLVVPHHAVGAAPTHVGVRLEARIAALELDTCLVP